jgi:hypothetical protein
MFRWTDLILIGIITAIIGLIVAAMIYTGLEEFIPIAGWVSVFAAMGCVSVVLILFYVKRWQWVRKYRYTIGGVEYFYELNASIYSEKAVRQDLGLMLERWFEYHQRAGSIAECEARLKNSICLFRIEGHWVPNFWNRAVTGLTTGNFAVVGQGRKPIDRTAHKHEMSHIYINRLENRVVGELESHEIFKQVGV